ncbi:undecaprenyl-phosphate glucose phosphotransferase [Bacillus sp. FJAT-29937]|uniref:undecaprenyl-phosphate glucose phosphotransferase n=1 Tax=Bacillus sp. FJAT-29937 TaxID=1720553 RepID=UPI00083576BE|nr:undecaprenyl-phosphate glucose phosphotransferase [Bacillus sp. FJAT-29937]
MIRGKEKFITKIYAGIDFIFIQFAFILAWILRFNEGKSSTHLPLSDYWFWGIIYGFSFILIATISTLYMPKRKAKFATELAKLFQAHLFSIFILLSVLYTVKSVDISRLFLFVFFMLAVFCTAFYRYFVKQSLRYFRIKGFNKQFILIAGAGKVGKNYYQIIQRHPEFGLEVVGFLDDYCTQLEDDYEPILGKLNELNKVLSSKLIDEVIIALPLIVYPKYKEIIAVCEKAGVRVSIIPDFYDILPATPYFQRFGDLPIIGIRDVPLDDAYNQIFKRVFDVVFALVAIILSSPVMFITAIVIKLTSQGPILFKQERVGLNRRTFYMYKFRSMKHMPKSQSDTQWTTENDPRRTKFGSFLRKTSLDELPQFFNVLKGEMSVVGPRPERPYFVDQFKEEVPKYMIKHHVRPGITGWAQVSGLRGDTSIADRIEHDLFYIEHWTILFDLKIIYKTVLNGFVNRNAY